jgi:hypothetical protein
MALPRTADVSKARLKVTRQQVLALRRRVGALDGRLPPGPQSLREAAWAGIQDSMPRAAILSIHARVAGTQPDTWKDPSLVQLWGPRFSTYLVAAEDRAVFTLGRLPDDAKGRQVAADAAARLHAALGGEVLSDREAGRRMGLNSNWLRHAAPTGTVLIRWEGARAPTIWTVPPPDLDPSEARKELARRYLHVFGPTTSDAFARWAGIGSGEAVGAFEHLAESLTAVRTPIGDTWILSADEPLLRAPAEPAAPARLLPSGDTYFLLQGDDRSLLIPEADRRAQLWTSRVWPGAVLVSGEIVGTWRRAGATLTITAWRRLSQAEREALEAEATLLPLAGLVGRIRVRWDPGAA